MKSFSINELERFSGIKAHTIRIWETRYALLLPERSATNVRSYSLEQTRRFLQVALLNQRGHRISHLASLDDDGLAKKVQCLQLKDDLQHQMIFELLLLMNTLQIEELERLLDAAVQRWGVDETIIKILLPFLQKADIFCYKQMGNEVHFVITAILQQTDPMFEFTNFSWTKDVGSGSKTCKPIKPLELV